MLLLGKEIADVLTPHVTARGIKESTEWNYIQTWSLSTDQGGVY